MVFNFAKLLMPSTMVAVPAGIVVVSYVQKSTTLVPQSVTAEASDDTSSKTVDIKAQQVGEDANTPDPTTSDEITPAAKPDEDTPNPSIDTPDVLPVPPVAPSSINTTTTDQPSSEDSSATQAADNTPVNDLDTVSDSSQAGSTPSDAPTQQQPQQTAAHKPSSHTAAISAETIQKAVQDPTTRKALIDLIEQKISETDASSNSVLHTKLSSTLNLLKTLNTSSNSPS